MKEPTNPFKDVTQVFEQMQNVFEEMAENVQGGAFEMEPSVASINVDLEDRDETFVLTAELPGFETDDIDVRVADRTLRLEAEHEEESEAESEGEYLRRERRRAAVARSVRLPGAVETDDISATYNNGILTVEMPKSEPTERGSEIEIN
jgi:HSP20 family protein